MALAINAAPDSLRQVLDAAAAPTVSLDQQDHCRILLTDMLGSPDLPREEQAATAFARDYGHHKSCLKKRLAAWRGTAPRSVGRPAETLSQDQLGAAAVAVASLFGPSRTVIPWAECADHLAKNLFLLGGTASQRRGWRQQLGVHLAIAGQHALVRANPNQKRSPYFVAQMDALGLAAISIHRAECGRGEADDQADAVSAAKRVEMPMPAMVSRVARGVRDEIERRTIVKGAKRHVTSSGISSVKMSESVEVPTLVDLLYTVLCGKLHLDLPASHAERVKDPAYNRAVSLAADVQYMLTGQPTPKHVGVAMACRSVSVPNGLIDLLHGLGVSVQADLARRIENGIAHDETMTHFAEIRRYLLVYGLDLVISVTGDNCDHLVKGSPDGKQFSYLQIEIRLSLRGGGRIDYIPPPTETVLHTALLSPLSFWGFFYTTVYSIWYTTVYSMLYVRAWVHIVGRFGRSCWCTAMRCGGKCCH